jgi:hypothetical protein
VRRLPSLLLALWPAICVAQELGPPFLVGYEALGVGAAMASSGDFVVVWDVTGYPSNVQARRFDASGQPSGQAFQVTASQTARPRRSTVAIDGSGNFTVAWQATQLGTQIFAQRFAPDGTRLGGEFRVNTYSAGSNVDAVSAATPSPTAAEAIRWAGSRARWTSPSIG